MYELTKVYATKNAAINAIRMMARNKGWQVLDTDAAATHVWPAAEGFSVNNTTLNVALGFVAEAQDAVNGVLEQRVPEGTITDGKALEAVNAALAEAAPVAPVPEAKPAKTKPAKEKEDKAPAARSETKNGARRPAKAGKTLTVWEVTERLQKQLERTPTIKEVYEVLCSMDKGFNKTTCSIQFYACLAYNGWQSERKAGKK